MKTLTFIAITFFLLGEELTLFDFDSKQTTGKWLIVNDDVMGGVSTSNLSISESGFATFSGELSPKNYGGFASIRIRVEGKEVPKSNGIKIRLKGDGKIYSIRFRTNSNFDGYAYQAKVTTVKGEWKEFKIPFEDFEPTYRGRVLSGKPLLEYENVAQFGLLVADKQFGKFSIDIDWIKIYQ